MAYDYEQAYDLARQEIRRLHGVCREDQRYIEELEKENAELKARLEAK